MVRCCLLRHHKHLAAAEVGGHTFARHTACKTPTVSRDLWTVVCGQLFAGHLFADNYLQNLFCRQCCPRRQLFARQLCTRAVSRSAINCQLVGVSVIQVYYRPCPANNCSRLSVWILCLGSSLTKSYCVDWHASGTLLSTNQRPFGYRPITN